MNGLQGRRLDSEADMRFLYGDSRPSPFQYNLLATLESLVSTAARTLQLDSEIDELQSKTAASIAEIERTLSALEAFHKTAMQQLSVIASQDSAPQTKDYERYLQEQASRFLEEARRKTLQATSREVQSSKVEFDKRKAEIRNLLDAFLTQAQLPSTEVQLSMTLVETQHQFSARVTIPQGIVATFALTTPIPAWSAPRRVAEFLPGSEQASAPKSWFRRSPEPERQRIEDMLVGGFDFKNSHSELRLRKKGDQLDSLLYALRREEERLTVEVRNQGEQGTEKSTQVLEEQEAARIELLLQGLHAATEESLSHKERLLSVTIDRRSVFEQEHLLPFFERVVCLLSPEVNEVSRRSPSPEELSLKIEDDAGHREEIYVRREDLLDKINALPERFSGLFAPFELTCDQLTAEDAIPSSRAPS